MIKIISGWSNPGGSTIAFINLCNLFNDNGIPCIFYGPHDYHLNFCKSGYSKDCKFNFNDIIISHFVEMKRPICSKFILSCHETDLYPLEFKNLTKYDIIHYVSEYQRGWHRVEHPYVVIPNVLPTLKKSTGDKDIAGVIGSIDPHKQTHFSIKRALNKNFKKVLIYGKITNINYFNIYISNLLSDRVVYMGVVSDLQKMYDSIGAVFHSSKRESFNYIEAECKLAQIPYYGLDSCSSGAQYLSNEEVLVKWKDILWKK